ncbi:uncharacterized protein LOC135488414 [Lineus longissimus]|uniref:uncharacterized protein LOC135488414 n=1 Tax=Lineus longissimus TaxID=88925 RepID=UPI002B4C53E7
MAEKQAYNQPMVVVGQPAYVEADYTIPRAKVPGIMMLVIACFNGIGFLVAGILTGAFGGVIELIVAFLLYGLVGFLATYAAFKQQKGQACVVAMIIFAVFALVNSFGQLIYRAVWILTGTLLAVHGGGQLSVLILIISCIAAFFAILVFILTIVLIVFGSKVVCQCCGAPSQASGGVIYQAAPSGQQA